MSDQDDRGVDVFVVVVRIFATLCLIGVVPLVQAIVERDPEYLIGASMLLGCSIASFFMAHMARR